MPLKKKLALGRRLPSALLAVTVTCAVIAAADWPTQSGGPQRDGWARSERVFTKENVRDLDLLYKYKADNQSRGLYSLTSPIIDGLLITYLGFKEMLVFSGSSDNVYSVDADLNRLIWKAHFDYNGEERRSRHSTVSCPGGLTASLAMVGSSSAGVSFGRRTPVAVRPGGVAPASLIGGSGFGSVGSFFAVSSDGYLHALNPSTGADLISAVKFLPANSRVSALNVDGNTIYAATSGNCGGHPNALYAVDLGSADKKVSSLPSNGSGVSGITGTAIGSDGTVYIQVPSEQGAAQGTHHRVILALEPQTLRIKDSFAAEDVPDLPKNVEEPGATPLVFSWKGKDLIVASGESGRLYLLDSTSLGGPDHRKAMFATEPIASADADYAGYGFRAGFSSRNDVDTATRWIYASLWGPPRPSAKFPLQNGNPDHGSIVAFKVSEESGQPVLSPAWISPDVASPAPSVTAGGMVFALSTGEPMRKATAKGKPYTITEINKASTHATLYAFDGDSGKQLYSSGDGIVSPSYGSGLAIANGRIYFATSDNSVYSFGFSKMQPQLTDK
jgi:outer membrane protein assembly factor BamB